MGDCDDDKQDILKGLTRIISQHVAREFYFPKYGDEI